MPSKGFFLCDEQVALGHPRDRGKDEECAELAGPARWNFPKYFRSYLPIEVKGIHVRLNYEIKNKKICSKKYLEEVINWLTDEYTEDAPADYKRYGGSIFGPIPLKELRNITQDVPVTAVKIRCAFFSPEQVKFRYCSWLWIKDECVLVHIKASTRSTSDKPELHRIGISFGFGANPTLQHQQSVLWWLIKSYSKDCRGFYCNWRFDWRGCFNSHADYLQVFGVNSDIKGVVIS